MKNEISRLISCCHLTTIIASDPFICACVRRLHQPLKYLEIKPARSQPVPVVSYRSQLVFSIGQRTTSLSSRVVSTSERICTHASKHIYIYI